MPLIFGPGAGQSFDRPAAALSILPLPKRPAARAIALEEPGSMKYLCLIYNNREPRPAGGGDAVTIRVRNGRLSAVTGGGGAAGEQLRDVVVIRARDLNDAIRVASLMPEAQLGSIEIRPVDDQE